MLLKQQIYRRLLLKSIYGYQIQSVDYLIFEQFLTKCQKAPQFACMEEALLACFKWFQTNSVAISGSTCM